MRKSYFSAGFWYLIVGLMWRGYSKATFFAPVVLWSCSPKVVSAGRKPPTKSPNDEIVSTARSYLGIPYRYGGMDRKGVDCSGLVCRVYLDAAGIQLPRTADAQALVGQEVKKENLEKGDLVFFKEPRSKRITHVGIVSQVEGGSVKFIHAASGRGKVVEDNLDDPHWRIRYAGARRIIPASKADAHTDPQEKSKP
ncbi:MAG: C40 family peptidase [Bacteroidia bacterium]|nr:C40 family peptidase [Bacteroidia bacterium]MDW8057953.1 C40 family peptidase [Bacteroidia bacterium]